MTEKWHEVDDYLMHHLMKSDQDLASTLQHNHENGLRNIDVSALQGQFLALLIQTSGATKVLEIGTLGGYSAIWMAKALPEHGHVTTLEVSEHCKEVAQANIDRAGLAKKITIIQGLAKDTLPEISHLAPFDFIFIDADKANSLLYFEWALKYAHQGTLIVCDNVIRKGEIIDPGCQEESIQGVRQLLEYLGKNDKVTVTALQTVGNKGWDGFALIRVN